MEIPTFLYRAVARCVEPLHVTTCASDQRHPNVGCTRVLGRADPARRGASSRFTQSNGDFYTLADTHAHTYASARSGPTAGLGAITLASYRGVSSLGMSITLGLVCCLIATLVVAPAIGQLLDTKRNP